MFESRLSVATPPASASEVRHGQRLQLGQPPQRLQPARHRCWLHARRRGLFGAVPAADHVCRHAEDLGGLGGVVERVAARERHGADCVI